MNAGDDKPFCGNCGQRIGRVPFGNGWRHLR